MPHIKFNWIDILFVTLLIRTGYVGYKKGFLPEFFRFLGLLTAFIFSFNNYTLLSGFIARRTNLAGTKPDIVSFLFIFLGAILLFNLIYLGLKVVLRAEEPQGPSKFIGFLLGCARGLLLISLICLLFVNGPFKYLSRSAKEKSFSGQYVYNIAPEAYKFCINLYPWKKIETPLIELLYIRGQKKPRPLGHG